MILTIAYLRENSFIIHSINVFFNLPDLQLLFESFTGLETVLVEKSFIAACHNVLLSTPAAVGRSPLP